MVYIIFIYKVYIIFIYKGIYLVGMKLLFSIIIEENLKRLIIIYEYIIYDVGYFAV